MGARLLTAFTNFLTSLEFPVALAIASIPILLIVLVSTWRYHHWAFPWPGIGDDTESFEDLLAALRLVAVPAAVIALLLIGGFLAHRYWPGPKSSTASPCACPSKSKSEGPACIQVCRDIPIDSGLAAALAALTQAVDTAANKLAGNSLGDVVSRLAAIETPLRAIAEAAAKPGPISPDLLGRLDKLQSDLRTIAEGASKLAPVAPQLLERLDASEKALRAIAESSTKLGSTGADLLDRLDKLRAGLSSIAAAAGKPAPIAPQELLERLDAIERALRAIPISPAKPGSAADLLDRLDKLQTTLHTLAAPPELLKRLDAIEEALRKIAGNSPVPPVLVTSQLEAIIESLTGIQVTIGKLDGDMALNSVIEHLTLIEAILSALPYPPPTPCGPLLSFAPLSEWTASERQLMDLASRRKLTVTQPYRVTTRQIFFDPQANQPSEIGMRILRLTAENARKRGFAMAIRAEADMASDGADAEAMARQRADATADYLALHASVPVVAIGLATPVGAASEPYRRIVRIDLLEPCVPDRTNNGGARTR